MPLCDAIDLCDFYEATGRTVRRSIYVDEIREEFEAARTAASLDGMI